MKPLALAAAAVAVLVAIGAGVAGWLIGTEAGLRFVLDRATSFTSGKLVVEAPRGSLAGTMTFDRLAFTSEGTSVTATGLRVRVRAGDLLRGTLRLDPLHVERIVVSLASAADEDPPRQAAPGLPASLALPIEVDIAQLTIGALRVERDSSALLQLNDIVVAYRGDSARHALLALRAAAPSTRIEAAGTLSATHPFALSLQGSATRAADAPPAVLAGTLTVRLGGDLRDLQASAEATGDTWRAHLDAALAPLTRTWPALLRSARLQADAIDLAAFSPALPVTRIGVRGDLQGNDNGRLAGTLEATNALAAPLDTQRLPVAAVGMRFESDLATATLTDLTIDLAPGGRLSGAGHVQRAPLAARFDVRARALDLRSVRSSLRATALDGTLDIDVLGPQRQRVTGTLAQPGITVTARADRDGADVNVAEARVAAFGGEASGNGRLSLDMPQAFEAMLRFAGFDPSRLGEFPAGSLNGRAALKGALAEPRRIDADWVIADSALRGLALRSRGSAQVAGARIAHIDATAALGRNHAAVQGAFGAAGDRLQWQVEAPALGQLADGLSGRIEGRGTFAGTPSDAAVTVQGTARALRLPGSITVADVRVDGTAGHAPDAPLRLALRARGVAAPGGSLDEVTVDARGVTGRHTAALRARAAGDALEARVSGGWRKEGDGPWGKWSGLLQALDLHTTRAAAVNTKEKTSAPAGQAAPTVVHLVRPAPLSVSPAAGQLQEAVFAVGDGQARIEHLEWQPGRLVSLGRLEGVPTRLLLTLVPVAPQLQTTVRLDGAWSVVMQPRLDGTLTLQRASGDVRLAGEPSIDAGLQDVRLDTTFTGGRVDARLIVRSAIGSIDATAKVDPVPAAAGLGFTAQAPFALDARLDVARIDAITRPLITAGRVSGRIAATLRGSGTLGTPRFEGQVQADGVGVEVPPYGIALHDGVVRARLQGDVVEVQRLEIRAGDGRFTAQGSLPLRKEAGRAALDWRAENFRLLNRPDMRLVLSGEGQAGFSDERFALRGRLHVDRGYFETLQRGLPAPGEDVVVVGRPAPVQEGDGKVALALDLRLELGKDLRVRAQGLSGKITGALQLTTSDEGELRAQGRLETVDATYRAYGQELVVDPGVLIFDGPIRNPTVDLTAWRRNQAVEAGVQVVGTAQAPRVNLVSDPVVPQGERLSWLVLGRAPGDAQGADLALLQAATGAVLGRGDSVPITQKIAGALGFDELAIRGSKEIASNVVALGKRLSDKFYITYEHGLGAAAESLVKLDYLLTRRISLRAETGSTSGFGILYRLSWD